MDTSSFHHDDFEKKDYLKAFALGLGLTVLAIVLQELAASDTRRPLFSLLSNGFLFAGTILFAGGVFSWIKKEGFFDVAIVGFKQLTYIVENSLRGDKNLDYMPDVQSYREKMVYQRRVNKPLLYNGLIYFVLSLIAALFYYY